MPRGVSKRKEILASSPLVEITLLHRAMRLELDALALVAESVAAARTVAERVARLDELSARYGAFDLVFNSHSAAEDDFIFPALARHGAQLLGAAEEHEEEAAMMRGVEEALRSSYAETSTDRLVSAFVQLKERLSEHMLREEDAVFPRLASFPAAELKRVVGLVLGSRSALVLEATIRMEVAHLEPAHARHVLSTMCEVTSKTKFREWLAAANARGLLERPLRPKATGDADGGRRHLADEAVARAAASRCPHYGHSALVVAACCGAETGCRRCHDELPACAVAMDPRAVTSVVCAVCAKEQPCAGACVECGHVFARYYCEVCRLWDESGAPTYHCPYCNVCRRGHGLGLDYHHCMLCNMCVSLDRLTTHQCDESSAAQCALCGEALFASQKHVDALPRCGHPSHTHCAETLPHECIICAATQTMLLDSPSAASVKRQKLRV